MNGFKFLIDNFNNRNLHILNEFHHLLFEKDIKQYCLLSSVSIKYPNIFFYHKNFFISKLISYKNFNKKNIFIDKIIPLINNTDIELIVQCFNLYKLKFNNKEDYKKKYLFNLPIYFRNKINNLELNQYTSSFLRNERKNKNKNKNKYNKINQKFIILNSQHILLINQNKDVINKFINFDKKLYVLKIDNIINCMELNFLIESLYNNYCLNSNLLLEVFDDFYPW